MSCTIKDVATARQERMPRGVVGFEVDPRLSLPAAVDRGDAASIAGWFALGHGPLGQVAALASCMSAAGLAVPAILQPDGPVAERGAGDQVEPVGLGDVVVEQPGALARNVGVQVAAELID
jgi:hypothetical protein